MFALRRSVSYDTDGIAITSDTTIMTGFVSFVSAGPGDPELLTIKGGKRLARADVILYDELSSADLLDLARPDAQRIAVGKRGGRPSTKQEHVNALLVHHAGEGRRVVRLKSGDAGIFGRLEEEIATLRAAGIGFEIVPGVTSACAAAAAAEIPLTRRLTSRRIQFVTGADVHGELPSDLNWEALADPKATTLVYMGKRTFPMLARQLIARGLAADTPALLAESVGTPAQRIVRATLEQLGEALQNDPMTATAIIAYGPLAAAG